MAEESAAPKTAEELIGDLESAFRAGEIGLSAFIIWEMLHRFPGQAGPANVYRKKLLRDADIAGVSLDAFHKNAKAARLTKNFDDLAHIAAIGLLKFPEDRILTLNLIEAVDKNNRLDLIKLALELLGEPARDDVVLLNARAALAQKEGDHSNAEQMFQKLLRIQPDNQALVENLSAAYVGLARYEDAIKLLESSIVKAPDPRNPVYRLIGIYRASGRVVADELVRLDQTYFTGCESRIIARAHSDINLFLENFSEVIRGLEAANSHKHSPLFEFELAEAKFVLGEFDQALKHYAIRFQAFTKLQYVNPEAAKYTGQYLDDESLLVWAEQGIGDESIFSYFFEELARRVKNVIVACDPRLEDQYRSRYPDWKFVNRLTLKEDLPKTDYACPSADLFALFLRQMLDKDYKFQYPQFTPNQNRLTTIKTLLGDKKRPRIGISWRGGERGMVGKIRSTTVKAMMDAIPASADLDIISFQYDEDHESEVIAVGDRRLALSGLNNRADLEGVFCLMSQCDAILSVDNAVAHFGPLLGVPTFVLIPKGQTQFRWRNEKIRKLFFPSARVCYQHEAGDWSSTLKEAWSMVLDHVNPE